MTVQPLPERIETTRQGKDDIDTNRRFLAIMEHPDNADIVRQVDMILAICDPAPVDEDEVAATAVAKTLGDDGLVDA